MTGLIKRFSGEKSHSLRSAFNISFKNGLLVVAMLCFCGGAKGFLSRNGLADAVGLAAAVEAPVGVVLTGRYLAPRKPQLGQSL
jgi:hypothetical protein